MINACLSFKMNIDRIKIILKLREKHQIKLIEN